MPIYSFTIRPDDDKTIELVREAHRKGIISNWDIMESNDEDPLVLYEASQKQSFTSLVPFTFTCEDLGENMSFYLNLLQRAFNVGIGTVYSRGMVTLSFFRYGKYLQVTPEELKSYIRDAESCIGYKMVEDDPLILEVEPSAKRVGSVLIVREDVNEDELRDKVKKLRKDLVKL